VVLVGLEVVLLLYHAQHLLVVEAVQLLEAHLEVVDQEQMVVVMVVALVLLEQMPLETQAVEAEVLLTLLTLV